VSFVPTLNTAWPVLLSDPVVRDHPQNRGRVAWWTVLPGWDGGPRWYDLMGRYHGTLTGGGTTNGWRPSTQPGAPAGCILGDGSTGYVEAPGAPATAYPLTLLVWAKLTAVPSVNGADAVALAVGKKSAVEEWWIGYYRTAGGVNLLRAVAQSNGGASLLQVTTTPTIDTGWHRIGAVFTSSSAAAVYLDGQPLSTSTPNTGGNPTGADTAWVGGLVYNSTTLYGPFPGQFNDATVYNRGLSAAEIAADYDLSRRGWPGVLNRLAPLAAVSVTVYLVGESLGVIEAPTSAAVLGVAESPTGSDAPAGAATWIATEGWQGDDPPALAASLEAAEAPGATDSAPTLTGLLIVADVGSGADPAALAGAWTVADAAPGWTELAETGAPILTIAESWGAVDPATLALAWTWTDTFGQSDAADHYDLLTPLDESAGWDDPLAYVPIYQVSESGLADEAPTWAVWSLVASDGAGLNADAATLASVLSAADRLPGDDLSGFVTPVMLVPDAGQGADVATLTPILVCADGGNLADAATAAATLLPADAGLATEPAPTVATRLFPSEAVAGTDAPTLASALTTRDTGTASDALTSARIGILTERGALAERLAAAALFLPTEGPTADDGTPWLAAQMPPFEALGGPFEALDAAAGWRLAELPTGREIVTTAAAWTASDALGDATERVGAAARLAIADADTWYEAIGDIHLMVGIREGWAPNERPALLSTFAVPDLGTGSDRPALAGRYAAADVGGVADGLVAGSTLNPREAPTAADGLRLAQSLTIADAGAGRSAVLLAGGMPVSEETEETEETALASAWRIAETPSALDAPAAAAAWTATDRFSDREALTGAATLPVGESLTPADATISTVRLAISDPSEMIDVIARSDAYSLAERGSWRDLASAVSLWGLAEAGGATDRAEGAAQWVASDDANTLVASTVAAALTATERAPGSEVLICFGAWQAGETWAGRDTSGCTAAWLLSDGGVTVAAAHATSVYQPTERLGGAEALETAARLTAADAGGVADRAGAASAATLAESVLLADSARSAATFPLSEAPTADAALFASHRWYASEGLAPVEVPSTVPTLSPSRLDTHLHSRIVPAAGTPAAPRARVTPVAPSAKITPAPGTPDPGRSTVR
jgi:hypothetical protein